MIRYVGTWNLGAEGLCFTGYHFLPPTPLSTALRWEQLLNCPPRPLRWKEGGLVPSDSATGEGHVWKWHTPLTGTSMGSVGFQLGCLHCRERFGFMACALVGPDDAMKTLPGTGGSGSKPHSQRRGKGLLVP